MRSDFRFLFDFFSFPIAVLSIAYVGSRSYDIFEYLRKIMKP